MPIRYQDWITRAEVQQNSEWYYLFGDNAQMRGYGGQAKEMRGEPNAIGIPTKKRPSMTVDSFFTDSEFPENIAAIQPRLDQIELLLKQGYTIVIPAAGLGTGLSRLDKTAPLTFQWLQTKLTELGAAHGLDPSSA